MFDGHFVLYYDLVCKESVVLWNRFVLGTNRLFKSHLNYQEYSYKYSLEEIHYFKLSTTVLVQASVGVILGTISTKLSNFMTKILL